MQRPPRLKIPSRGKGKVMPSSWRSYALNSYWNYALEAIIKMLLLELLFMIMFILYARIVLRETLILVWFINNTVSLLRH
jgi:hypothetical protein